MGQKFFEKFQAEHPLGQRLVKARVGVLPDIGFARDEGDRDHG